MVVKPMEGRTVKVRVFWMGLFEVSSDVNHLRRTCGIQPQYMWRSLFKGLSLTSPLATFCAIEEGESLRLIPIKHGRLTLLAAKYDVDAAADNDKPLPSWSVLSYSVGHVVSVVCYPFHYHCTMDSPDNVNVTDE